jgi:hypothetical protein
LINDPKPLPAGNPNIDRYVRTGVILFDSQGRLSSSPLSLRAGSALGDTIGLIATTPVAGIPFYTQLGVVLYDRQAFVNQPGNTEGDYVLNGIPTLQPDPPPGARAQEATEELWIDQNSLPLFVNRFNGNLLRGE